MSVTLALLSGFNKVWLTVLACWAYMSFSEVLFIVAVSLLVFDVYGDITFARKMASGHKEMHDSYRSSLKEVRKVVDVMGVMNTYTKGVNDGEPNVKRN